MDAEVSWTDVEIRDMSQVTDMLLKFGLPASLRSLSLIGLRKLTVSSVGEVLTLEVAWLPSLQKLRFDVGTGRGSAGTLASKFLASLSPNVPLKSLFLPDVPLVNDVFRNSLHGFIGPTLTSMTLWLVQPAPFFDTMIPFCLII
ncbi:hypothetical protein AMAG_20530 [Allomyces macrogynus ATCC 38327]|uniref:Uncharacterized protein n=1 Tax=Allomyces macrogynus (strain ATCC 38327) TaxID=578462 RepID=A0A0L0TCV5_ALLM3|nr:hypothetical protein AMAG_20530 [Allomyces macrogynus ATCC 38327]|eukprot:KNE72500.1 hypothetical protein AMAG_20530 [Allomyces macrogynus ATCC 38327]